MLSIYMQSTALVTNLSISLSNAVCCSSMHQQQCAIGCAAVASKCGVSWVGGVGGKISSLALSPRGSANMVQMYECVNSKVQSFGFLRKRTSCTVRIEIFKDSGSDGSSVPVIILGLWGVP